MMRAQRSVFGSSKSCSPSCTTNQTPNLTHRSPCVDSVSVVGREMGSQYLLLSCVPYLLLFWEEMRGEIRWNWRRNERRNVQTWREHEKHTKSAYHTTGWVLPPLHADWSALLTILFVCVAWVSVWTESPILNVDCSLEGKITGSV